MDDFRHRLDQLLSSPDPAALLDREIDAAVACLSALRLLRHALTLPAVAAVNQPAPPVNGETVPVNGLVELSAPPAVPPAAPARLTAGARAGARYSSTRADLASAEADAEADDEDEERISLEEDEDRCLPRKPRARSEEVQAFCLAVAKLIATHGPATTGQIVKALHGVKWPAAHHRLKSRPDWFVFEMGRWSITGEAHRAAKED